MNCGQFFEMFSFLPGGRDFLVLAPVAPQVEDVEDGFLALRFHSLLLLLLLYWWFRTPVSLVREGWLRCGILVPVELRWWLRIERWALSGLHDERVMLVDDLVFGRARNDGHDGFG